MISGLVVLVLSLVAGLFLVGGLGRLALRVSKLEYEGVEKWIAVICFGIAVLSTASITLSLAGLFNPTSVKVLLAVSVLAFFGDFKVPKFAKPGKAEIILALLLLPAFSYILISPVVEKDFRNLIAVQHLISSGQYDPAGYFLGDFFFVYGSAALASVFDFIPAYNLLSGYGWLITAAMLYGVYLLGRQLEGENAGIAAMILVTCFQLYSRTIDYRSTLMSIAFFIYFVYLTQKEMDKQRKILCGILLLDTALINPLGFAVSIIYLLFVLVKSDKWLFIALTIAASLLMQLNIVNLFLGYGLFLAVGVAGLWFAREKKGIRALYMAAFALLIAASLLKLFSVTLIRNIDFDVMKDDMIYIIPLALCISGACLLNRHAGKYAICTAVLIVLIPHQAWFYQAAANLHIPSREEVHSYQPYPGGVTGSPFILPIQATYMTFRYYDAYSPDLFPVSIYGKDRTQLLSYLFYKTNKRGYFTDLTQYDRFQEFEAVMKYSGILDAGLNETEKELLAGGSAEDKRRLLKEKNVRWVIVSAGQENTLLGVDGLKGVYHNQAYAILEYA